MSGAAARRSNHAARRCSNSVGLLAGLDEFFKDGQSLLAADAVVGQCLPHVAQGLKHASPHSHGVRKDGRQHQARCAASRASQLASRANSDFVESQLCFRRQPARRENALRAWRRPGSHGGGWCRRAEPAARPGAYALLSRADGQLTRAGQRYYSHLGLRPPSKDFDYNQPLIREGVNDYILLRNGQKKLVRSLQGGEQLGKGFFRDKYYEYLVHVPVIIRGRRRSGRNAGAGYERRDWLPVNELGGATRHPAHLTEEQVAQRVRQQVEASLDPGGPILQLSDETYFLDPEGHWVVSTQSTRYRNSRTEVETLLRQRMRGLRSVP